MYTSLRLQNYRSYTDTEFKLIEGVNIVVGPNASGKTNLLEALFVLNQGGSFRVSDDALVRRGSDWARIDAADTEHTRALLLEQTESSLRKTLVLDGGPKKRFMPQKAKPTTLFEPEHLRFLVGSPELRRTYLDGVIAQSDPTYKNNLSQYRRALLQRNRLLKKQPSGWQDQLFVWDLKLSDFGHEIVQARRALVDTINQQLSDLYSQLSDTKSTAQIEYTSSVEGKDYRSALLSALSKKLDTDKLRGATSVGPHRDDLHTWLNETSAATSASRGESRTIVLALKIIELQLLEKNTGQKPLLLLDDVFSELDSVRRRALTTHLSSYQTIITTTDADAIMKHLPKATNLIKTS